MEGLFLSGILRYHLMLSGSFCGPESRHWVFGGLNFGPGIVWGFVWSPKNFFGFRFLSPFDHPCHLKSPSPQGFCDRYYSNQIGCLKPFRNHLFPRPSIVITTHPLWHRKLLMSSSRPRAIMALEQSNSSWSVLTLPAPGVEQWSEARSKRAGKTPTTP